MTKTLLISAALALWPLAHPLAAQVAGEPATRPATFRNPLKARGADPWMQYVDGWYYLATTTGSDVQLRRARKIADLHNAEDVVVWKDAAPERSHGVWAPEFHRLSSPDGDRWYLYVTAFDGKDDNHHRMFVAQSTTDSVMGPYETKAKLLTDPQDAFYAIDGTVFTRPDGSLYFIWCGRPSPTGQGLYISRMSNPWTLEGERVYLEADGFGCNVVREGPVILKHARRMFLVYSMCGADTPDYRLGMLVADENADPLDVKQWKQHPKVLFSRSDENRVYGPGHNSFFKSPDGSQDWIVYHAKTTARLTYADRTTRAQPIRWNADGTPDFGIPAAESTDIPVPSGE